MRAVALLLLAVALSAATAVGFDGRQHSGRLELLADGVRIDGVTVPLADLDSVTLEGTVLPRTPGAFGVLLVDGSWLPARALAVAGSDRLVVEGTLGRLELPLEAVIGWGSPELPPVGTDDALTVASGVLRGRLLGIADGRLRLQSALDPEPLLLAVGDVRAARLVNPARRVAGPRLRLAGEPAAPALDLLLRPGAIVLAAAPQVAVDPAVLGGRSLRVEGGRRAYLSDLRPSEVREDGHFGVVWPHSRDRALGGGDLLLGGIRHGKGLVVHAPAMLAWRLEGAYARLRAQVGISDEVAPEGDCLATLSGDGRVLWQARLRGGEPAVALDLPLAGIDRLELVLAIGERQDIGDHVVLGDAQLIRR
jgi:hypothetical protein